MQPRGIIHDGGRGARFQACRGVPTRRRGGLAGTMVALALLAGCSTGMSRAADPASYTAMNCNELNRLLGKVSSDLSQRAIARGKVEQTDIPRWIPGGRRVASKVVERQTARIENIQQRERVIASARDRACPGRQP